MCGIVNSGCVCRSVVVRKPDLKPYIALLCRQNTTRLNYQLRITRCVVVILLSDEKVDFILTTGLLKVVQNSGAKFMLAKFAVLNFDSS